MIIRTEQIITGDGSTVLRGEAVCIDENGSIVGIGSLEALRARWPDAPVRDYPGATLLPGLIDMHVHTGYWWSKPDSAEYNDYLVAYMALDNARRALQSGVTTIRDVSSPAHLCVTMTKAAQKGFIDIPRIVNSGVGLCMTGGHGWPLKGGIREVDGPWALRTAVREQIRDGAQWIKLLTSHRTDTPEFTQEELDAAVDEAHRVGVKIAVHAGTQPAIGMCIDAGFDTIEHGTYMTVAQARRMREKNLVWVPTIIAYTAIYEYLSARAGGPTGNVVADGAMKDYDYYKRAAEAYRDHFAELIATGVRTVTGTDMVIDGAPATPVAREVKYMVDYGMEPLSAIRAATANGAEALGMADRIGQVKEGLAADLLVVRGDPLADIAALSDVAEVYAGGKPVCRNGGRL